MKQLFQYLKASKITQADLAQTVGCSQASISRFVKGQALPSLRLAKRIERATLGAVRTSDWVTADESGGGGTDA